MPQESKSLKTLSESMAMSWCMFIRARLLNFVSFLVLRRYVFNLRKQLRQASSEVQKKWCECLGTWYQCELTAGKGRPLSETL